MLLSLCSCVALLHAAATRAATVADVQALLDQLHAKKDDAIAKELSQMQMTERVSSGQLAKWNADFTGTKTRQALMLLADESAFLELPAQGIPAAAAPDLDAQRAIMSLAVDYVHQALPRIPNFYATRATVRFVDTPPETGRHASDKTEERKMRYLDEARVTVLVRDGKELVDPGKSKNAPTAVNDSGMSTTGVFGVVLGRVILDAAHGRETWGHWENASDGRRAVFDYAVPQAQSHYEVEWCCAVTDGFEFEPFRKQSSYHGEIAIDPESGAIRRMTMVADLDPGDPLVRSSIAVEYAPVEIGGRRYICPVRSVSITVGEIVILGRDQQPPDEKHKRPLETSLNDVVFDDYHLFRSESRILTGAESPPAEAPGAPGSGSAEPAAKPQM